MSARKSSVPIPSRRRAKTSFQALFLVVRATASHSNPAAVAFNFNKPRPFERRNRLPKLSQNELACALLLHLPQGRNYCAPADEISSPQMQRRSIPASLVFLSFLRAASPW